MSEAAAMSTTALGVTAGGTTAGGAWVPDARGGGSSTVEALEAELAVVDAVVSWQDRALCAETDPEAFFPEKGGSTREAKKICVQCPVRAECLEYALANDERFGIWGGLSERERRRLRRRAV